jgi:hypothetical protein
MTGTPRARCATALCVAALFLVAPAARADNPAAAKALFDHGLDELKKNNLPAACTAFAESYKLNPLPGALFTVAECEAKRGRIATAVKRYEEYLTVFAALPRDKKAKQHGRDVLSKEQITKLTPDLPKVTLLVPPDAPAGVVITLDGITVDRAALSAPLPVDPGDHTVFAHAPGAKDVEKRFTMDKGEQKTIPVEIKLPPPPPVEPTSPPVNGARIGAYVAGGVGIGSLVVGAVTGGLTAAKKSVIEDNCVIQKARGIATCNATGLAAGRSATTLGAVSTATFILGGIGVGAAIGLFVASGSSDKKPEARSSLAPLVWVGPDHALFGARGTW